MDNTGGHKAAGVREAAGAAGTALRYLPPCSPDMNPIERVSAKPEEALRAAARTTETLWTAVGEKLAGFLPDERVLHLAHCGHGDFASVPV